MNDLKETCEHCGSNRIYHGPPDCPMCGAPNCCQTCCKIDSLLAENAKKDERIRELQKERDEATAEVAAFLEWMKVQQGWEGFWADGFLGQKPISQAKQNLQAIRRFLEEKGHGLKFLAARDTLAAENARLRGLIEAAPHGRDCEAMWYSSLKPLACDCWKSRALPPAPANPAMNTEHNPDNLTPEQYGAPEWRLLRKGEILSPGDQYRDDSIGRDFWTDSITGFTVVAQAETYRRRVSPPSPETDATFTPVSPPLFGRFTTSWGEVCRAKVYGSVDAKRIAVINYVTKGKIETGAMVPWDCIIFDAAPAECAAEGCPKCAALTRENGQLHALNQRLSEVPKLPKEYEDEISRCDGWIQWCKDHGGDWYGINFHQGMRAGIVFGNIISSCELSRLRVELKVVTDSCEVLEKANGELRAELESKRQSYAVLERAANAMRATLERSLQHHGCDPCHITEALEQFDALKKP